MYLCCTIVATPKNTFRVSEENKNLFFINLKGINDKVLIFLNI